MNEPLVDACLHLASLVAERDRIDTRIREAHEEVARLRRTHTVDERDKLEAQVKTAPGRLLEQEPHTRGLTATVTVEESR